MSASTVAVRDGEPRSVPNANPVDPAWAWAPYKPDGQRPWNLVRAGHLFRRAAFGATWTQIQQSLEDGPDRTIDRLLRPETDATAFHRKFDGYDAAAARSNEANNLRSWWLRRMIETPHALREKMTLFWHNHFAINNANVKYPRLTLNHIRLLRQHALGQFDSLLQAVMRDPATLLGLNAEANRKAQPNEELARQVLDRYVLGPGCATATDVRDTARAFAGWFVAREKLRFFESERDDGPKQVLGQTGDFQAEDVVNVALKHPATPKWIVRKLYRCFVSEVDTPDDRLIQPLADAFGRDYDIFRVVETILRSNLFFSDKAYRARIKSPVEFGVGIVVALEGIVPTDRLGRELAALGQNLYHPPAGDGWAGGRHWINPAILVGRSNLGLSLLSGKKDEAKLDPWKVANGHGFSSPTAAGEFLMDLFVGRDLPDHVSREMLGHVALEAVSGKTASERQIVEFAHALFALPEFQLA